MVDLVMDNAGFELVADLALADFLLSAGLADRVRLRVKRHPWFVSDTTVRDVWWTIQQLESGRVPEEEKVRADLFLAYPNQCRWREFSDGLLFRLFLGTFYRDAY